MRVEEKVTTGGSTLINHYYYQYHKLQDYFAYHPFIVSSWKERVQWLEDHPIPHRKALVEGLLNYNRRMQNHPNAHKNIELLLEENSYAIVGGQQAGLLTGPLYVIHKAITLIHLANELTQKTGKNMVPVFWIASEDHDWDEVDHTYILGYDQEIKKVKIHQIKEKKDSVAEVELDSSVFIQAINEMFSVLPDSLYQQELREKCLELATTSTKLNDFFARVMAWLFGEFGLILIDSADPFVRELEKPILSRLIKENINSTLQEVQEQLILSGYHSQLDIQEDSAHLFVHHNGERKLMVRDGDYLRSKDGELSFSIEEVQQLLEQEPTKFSSNVVSRPIMQESILPVMAFVGGPGEIAYWAQLNPVFTHFGLQMPIVYPRLSFTLIDRKTEKFMQDFGLSLEDVMEQWEEKRKSWIHDHLHTNLEEEFQQLRQDLSTVYQSFLLKLLQVEPGMKNLGESTLERLNGLTTFLETKTTLAIDHRHEAVLRHWETIRKTIKPLEKPQERVFNVFMYLNQYGTSWLEDLIRQPFSLDASHKVVYI